MRDTHVASSVVDVLRVATDGGARELFLLRVVLDEAPGAAGGCAVVGAVDDTRPADLFGDVEDDSLGLPRDSALAFHEQILTIPFLAWSASFRKKTDKPRRGMGERFVHTEQLGRRLF